MLTADKIQDMGEYLNYAFETMLKLWRTVDYGECVNEPVIACDGKVVDSGHQLLTIRGADLDHLKALFRPGRVGEFPFILKPRLFGLFDDEADLDLIGRCAACRAAKGRKGQAAGKCQTV